LDSSGNNKRLIVPVSLTVTATDADSNAIPAITELIGNYPNPFNPETVIKYGLKTDTKVLLEIYNLRGQKVKTLINDSQSAGYHQITWNGRDKTGKQTASGVYFYIMKTDNFEKTRKMILLK
jgi:flagellar hook assembly protein FlgD